MIFKGKIENNPTLRFHYYNDVSVVYFSKEEQKIQCLNIKNNEFSNSFNHMKLPTE